MNINNLYYKLIQNIETKIVLYKEIFEQKSKITIKNKQTIEQCIKKIIIKIEKLQRYEEIEKHYDKKLIKQIHHTNLDLFSLLNMEISKQVKENNHNNFLKKIKEEIKNENELFFKKLKTICYIQEILSRIYKENKIQIKILQDKNNNSKNLKESLLNEFNAIKQLHETLNDSRKLTINQTEIEKNILKQFNIIKEKKKNITKKNKKTQIKLSKEEKFIGKNNEYLIEEKKINEILKEIDNEFLFIYNNQNFEIHWNCVPILRKKISYIINQISISFNKKIEEKYDIKIKKPILVITDTIRTKEEQEKINSTNPHAALPEKSRHVSANAIDIGINSSTNNLIKILYSNNKINIKNELKKKIFFKQKAREIRLELDKIINNINKEYIEFEKRENKKAIYHLLYPIKESSGCYHISFNSSIDAKRFIYRQSLKL